MKIAFITRSTFYKVPGGDTIQVRETARQIKQAGNVADIVLTNAVIDYKAYDLFYFSNITRPADILFHLKRIKKPFVVAPILIDYSEFDMQMRKGLAGSVLRRFSRNTNEYIKTIARWVKGRDVLRSKNYLWKGQDKSIREILNKAAAVFPGTETEYQQLTNWYGTQKNYAIVPNGIDPLLFQEDVSVNRNTKLVICAARIEGIKNQLNLIKAVNNTRYTLILIGSAAPNQQKYYQECRRIAGSNIFFYQHMPQQILMAYYKAATVHALPSWFETCGLSSLEAAAMGCNIAITAKGYTRDYFGEDAFYCDPAEPDSIFSAIDKAAKSDTPKKLQQKIIQQYTWQHAAAITLETCKNIISG